MPDALRDIGQSLFDEEDCLLSVDLPLNALARRAPLIRPAANPATCKLLCCEKHLQQQCKLGKCCERLSCLCRPCVQALRVRACCALFCGVALPRLSPLVAPSLSADSALHGKVSRTEHPCWVYACLNHAAVRWA
jgi:hypothetical protein